MINYEHIDTIVDGLTAKHPEWPRGVVEESVICGFIGGLERAKQVSIGIIRDAINGERDDIPEAIV